MSQLQDQLIKPPTIPLMIPLGQNMNLINQVPMPGQLQNQPNLPLNQNMPIGVQGPDHNSHPNQDTSNYLLIII